MRSRLAHNSSQRRPGMILHDSAVRLCAGALLGQTLDHFAEKRTFRIDPHPRLQPIKRQRGQQIVAPFAQVDGVLLGGDQRRRALGRFPPKCAAARAPGSGDGLRIPPSPPAPRPGAPACGGTIPDCPARRRRPRVQRAFQTAGPAGRCGFRSMPQAPRSPGRPAREGSTGARGARWAPAGPKTRSG